jgi:hypothetical protein
MYNFRNFNYYSSLELAYYYYIYTNLENNYLP